MEKIMNRTFIRIILCMILTVYTLIPFGGLRACAAENISENAENEGERVKFSEDGATPVLSEDVVVGSRIWELLFGKKEKALALIPGGDVFGIKIKLSHVTVADSKGIPALSPGDVILSINGKEIKTAEEARAAISASGGESVTIRALHRGERVGIEVRPTLMDGEYRLGLTLRDGVVGIGTVTFVDPETGLFGGLGHGICDSDSGELADMECGEVTGALLGSIHKGEVGKPGELTGILTEQALGTVYKNCECGVFGYLDEIPEGAKVLEIATRDAVHEGEATIISTVRSGKTAEYKIEIYDIDKSSSGSKSFRIRVTDEALKALSGGIVRGMSGSPIIQDGKLVGAVTHVMVANPTEGYGIFIENMLNAANNQSQQKAA